MNNSNKNKPFTKPKFFKKEISKKTRKHFTKLKHSRTKINIINSNILIKIM